MKFDRELARTAGLLWAPNFPRKTVDGDTWQFTVTDSDDLLDALERTHGKGAGFISTYSFPHGHSTDGNIPRVDTLMYDLDVPSTKEYAPGDTERWHQDMSALLARVRIVAKYLVENEMDTHWRASLSGFKGIHFYQDFPAIHPDNGNQNQFKSGLKAYSDGMIGFLESETHVALAEWMDVDSSDLGRLTRHPNTVHTGATKFFGEQRWCVPVSIRELASIDTDRYVSLTREPREYPGVLERNPDEHAGKVITGYIRQAGGGDASGGGNDAGSFRSFSHYEANVANQNITSLDDVKLLTADRPCVWAYRERGDQFEYGAASHTMEVYVMSELVWKNVPVSVILDFFRDVEGFTEAETITTLKGVIEANWRNRFTCKRIHNDVDGAIGGGAAPFCVGHTTGCGLFDEDEARVTF